MTAPRSAASRALRTTRRASSTQQSEYSKPVAKTPGFSGAPALSVGEIEHAGAGQALPAAQVIVEEEPGAQHPGGPQARLIRQHEAQGPHDVRRDCPQHLALG